jgi:curved DNA-binding protein CbpA
MASTESYYEILGVARSANAEEIRAAYLKLARELHPDRHQDNPLKDLAARRLVSVNEAYQTLGDAQRRATYDAQLQTPSRPTPSALDTHTPAAQRLLMVVLALLALPLLLRFGLPLLRLVFRLIRWVFSIL